MKFIAAIVLVDLFSSVFYQFLPEDTPSWLGAILGQQFVLVLAAIYIYHQVDFKYVLAKTALLLWVLGQAIDIVTISSTWFLPKSSVVVWLCYLLAIATAFASLYHRFSKRPSITRLVDRNNILLVCHKPNTTLGLFGAVVGLPYDGLGVSVKDKWYGFKKGKGFVCTPLAVAEKLKDKYFIIDTGWKFSEADIHILNELSKSKWTLINNNCVTVFKKLFARHGVTLHFWDALPHLFVLRFM